MIDPVTCPACQETSEIGSLIGKTTDNCPKCGKSVLLPAPEANFSDKAVKDFHDWLSSDADKSHT